MPNFLTNMLSKTRHAGSAAQSAIRGAASRYASAGGLGSTGLGASALAGGAYGAFSENTSVLGGAMMGAGIYAGARMGGVGMRAYTREMARSGSRSMAGGYALGMMGKASKRFIGMTAIRANRGINSFRSSLSNIGGIGV